MLGGKVRWEWVGLFLDFNKKGPTIIDNKITALISQNKRRNTVSKQTLCPCGHLHLCSIRHSLFGFFPARCAVQSTSWPWTVTFAFVASRYCLILSQESNYIPKGCSHRNLLLQLDDVQWSLDLDCYLLPLDQHTVYLCQRYVIDHINSIQAPQALNMSTIKVEIACSRSPAPWVPYLLQCPNHTTNSQDIFLFE